MHLWRLYLETPSLTGVNTTEALQFHPDPCPAQEASGRKQSARSGNSGLALGSLLVSLLVGNVDVTLADLLHATLFSCPPRPPFGSVSRIEDRHFLASKLA